MLQGVRRHLFPQQEIPAKASMRQQRVFARRTVQVSAYSAGASFVEVPTKSDARLDYSLEILRVDRIWVADKDCDIS